MMLLLLLNLLRREFTIKYLHLLYYCEMFNKQVVGRAEFFCATSIAVVVSNGVSLYAPVYI